MTIAPPGVAIGRFNRDAAFLDNQPLSPHVPQLQQSLALQGQNAAANASTGQSQRAADLLHKYKVGIMTAGGRVPSALGAIAESGLSATELGDRIGM